MHNSIEKASEDLRNGKFIIIYDGLDREGEADLIIHSSFATPKRIEKLRKDAGGMIVLAIGKKIAQELSLPFLHEIFGKSGIKNTYVKTNYNDPPPYSIPINHNNAHTGVTDNDKALAIKDFSKIFREPEKKNFFEKNFRTPGHLPICVSHGIDKRHGHTELAVELAHRAKIEEAVVLCEMLGSGKALSKKEAKDYAKKNNLVFLEGREIYG